MTQKTKPAGGGLQCSRTTDSLSWIGPTKEALLQAALIEVHAERAGFRRGRAGKWHCAIHRDRNASCTMRDSRITCWVCNSRWNAIDLEMVARGEPFMRTLRAMAAEYGIHIDEGPRNPVEERRAALARREAVEKAAIWRTGALRIVEEMLVEEKGRLFDPGGGRADEALIRHLTDFERSIRNAGGPWRLVEVYRAAAETMPEVAARMVTFGAEAGESERAFVEWLVDRLAVLQEAA